MKKHELAYEGISKLEFLWLQVVKNRTEMIYTIAMPLKDFVR